MSQRPSETLYLHLFVSASCSLTGSWSDLFSCRAPPYCSGEHDLPVVSGSLGDSLISSGTAVLTGSGAELSSSQALCFSGKSWQDAADLHTITRHHSFHKWSRSSTWLESWYKMCVWETCCRKKSK